MAESPFQFAGAVGDYLTGKARDIAETAPTLRDIGNAGIGAVDGVGLGLPSWAAGKLAGAQNPFALAKAESPNAYDIGELVSMVPLRTAALGGAASYGRRVDAAAAARQQAEAAADATFRQNIRDRMVASAESARDVRQRLEGTKDLLQADPDVHAWLKQAAGDQLHRDVPIVSNIHIRGFNELFGAEKNGVDMASGYIRRLVRDTHAELKGAPGLERTGLTLRSEKAKVAADPDVAKWAEATAAATDGQFTASHIKDFATQFGDRFSLRLPPAYIRSILNIAHENRQARAPDLIRG
jgi:hypothetical protein